MSMGHRRPPRRRGGVRRAARISLWTVLIVVCVPVLLVLAIVALSPVRVTFLTPQIELVAERLMSRKLEIEGELAVSLRKFAQVTVGGLELEGPDGATLVDFGTLSVSLNPWALVFGRLDGRIVIENGTAGVLNVAEAEARAVSGEPLRFEGTGGLGPLPGKLTLETAPPETFLGGRFTAPVEIVLALADARLELGAEIVMPAEAGPQRLRFDLSGQSVAAFTPLIDTPLPPLGPYTLTGVATATAKHLTIDDLRLTVGASDLTGRFDARLDRPRPVIDVALRSEVLQLDDFLGLPLTEEEQAALEAKEAAAAAAPPADDDEAWVGDSLAGDYAEDLRFLADLDVTLKVDVDEVRSGEDVLGGGALGLIVGEDRVTVDPIEVRTQGGQVNMTIGLDGTNPDILHAAWTADVDRFDFGILLRRLDPETKEGGLVSVRGDLDMRHAEPRKLMAGANGHLDLGVWPENLSAGLVDLWAVSLFNALTEEADPSEGGSQVNCAVVRLAVKDGIMTDEVLLIDTSRIMIGGDIQVDFIAEKLELYAVPESKRPQLFAAKTPIQATGTLDNFEVGPAPGGIVGTVFRIVTSPFKYPFELAFSSKPTADGEPQCTEAYERPVAELRKAAGEEEEEDSSGAATPNP